MLTNKNKYRVTLSDVAKQAGVSKSTASLVLNNSTLIKPETIRKVECAIEELGYVYNRSAASLRSQNSKTIGIVIDDLMNPFFAEFTMGVETTLAEHGYITMMANTSQGKARQKEVLDALLEHHVAGIILFPVNGTKEHDLGRYLKSHTPLLIAMRSLNWSQIPLDYVGVDSQIGVFEATEYLIINGHSKIAFIGGYGNHSRYQGYIDAIKKHGLKTWGDDKKQYYCEPTRENGYLMMLKLLESNFPPTAVLCYNDLMAFGAISALGELNIKVGENISLIGHDGITACAFSNPPLTTIAMEPLLLGQQAAKQILQRIASPNSPVGHCIFRPTLQIRASTSKIIKKETI